MQKNTLRIALLGAVMAAGSFTSFTRAADETPKPAPAATAPARPSAADIIKNYRDQFEGLNLSDDQMKKIDGFIETAEAEVKKAAAEAPPADGTRRRGGGASFAALRKLGEDVQSVLNDTQKGQLAKKRQTASIDRMKKPFLAPELKLTEDQTKKINDIIAEMTKALPTPTAAPMDQEARTKMFQLYRDTREKLKAVLTPEQQKLVPEPRFGGGRGGARGNRNGQTTTPAAPAK